MKKIIMISMSAAYLAVSGCGAQKDAPQLTPNNIDEVVAAMTLEEKVLLLVGIGMPGENGTQTVVGETNALVPGAAGLTHAIPRLGIPSIVLADGPAGLRIKPKRENDTATYYCTAFPVGVCLAASWNKKLIENTGESIGNEVKEYGCDILLAPGSNIHRNILCGRNYEYFSEDPVLSGMSAAAYIKGVQKNDVGTSLKHFALNNQETNRSYSNSKVSDRAAREIYYRQFEIAVKDAKPWTVMTSYNYINGVYSSQDQNLIQNILRKDWGFDGLVMTDWFGGDDAAQNIIAGNDLMMPGTDKQYNRITEAYKSGLVTDAQLNACVKKTLQLIVKCPRFKGYKYSNKPDLKLHATISRSNACEGIVLLKNNNDALPFTNQKQIAVFGITSYNFLSGGIGSGDVNEAYTVDMCTGLTNAGYKFDSHLQDIYTENLKLQQEQSRAAHTGKADSMFFKFVAQDINIDNSEIQRCANSDDAAVITFGRMSGEFADRNIKEFYLSDTEKNLVKSVCEAFKAKNKKVVVVLNVCGAVETSSWKDMPDAIIVPWMGGQEGGNAVADVISGKVNPSGKLPMTFPVDYFDVPGAKNFPYDIVANDKSKFGDKCVNRDSIENYDFTNYTEDIFVGYRGYEKNNTKVSYPFGYGLSYTTFAFSDLKAEKSGDVINVSVTIKNTGKVAGKEVAQLFVSAPQNPERPKRELKNFEKSDLINPGQSQTLSMSINVNDLARWDVNSFVVDKGKYKFSIADLSVDVEL